jgi:hypothetical protein
MGLPTDEKERFDWEDRHYVTISCGFWLDETVVAQTFGYLGAGRPLAIAEKNRFRWVACYSQRFVERRRLQIGLISQQYCCLIF